MCCIIIVVEKMYIYLYIPVAMFIVINTKYFVIRVLYLLFVVVQFAH